MGSILRRINNRLGKDKEIEIKAAAGNPTRGILPLSNVRNYTAQSLLVDFESMTKWAYRSNELVNACMGERGRALREAPLRIYNEHDDKWDEGNEIETLMKRPNPFRSQPEFWESIEQHLLLSGNAFIYKVRDSNGKVVQLWLKKPHMMKVVPHPTKFISHYIYVIQGIEYILPVEDVIHVMYIDPDNDYYGLSPLVAAARKIDADTELGKFMKYVLLNMATTSGVFVTDKKLGQDERQILEDKMVSRYVGAIRAGLPMVLSHGMKWEQTSMNMKELEIGNLASWIESRICLTLHVPAVVVGAKVGLDKSTFTNVREARIYMYENTIAPEWQMLADKVGTNLLFDFGMAEGNVARFDTRQIKALQESETELWERVDTFEGLSIVEKRVKIGYPKDPDGIVYMDANKVPVDIKTGEGLTPREPDPDLSETPAGQDPDEEKVGAEVENKKKNKPESKGRRLLTPPTPEQRQQLLDNIVEIEDRNLPLMLVAVQRTFESIALEIGEYLDKEGIKTKAKVPAPPRGMTKRIDDVLLKQRIEDTVGKGMVNNINTVLAEGADGTKRTLGYGFGLTNEEAVKYARKHTNRLSGAIAESSVKDVRETIAQGIADGKDLRKVRGELMEKVNGWSEARAETVARTETLSAANEGSLAIMKKAGIEYKEWLAAPDACPFCRSLANQVSAIDSEYQMENHSMNIPVKTRPGYYGVQAQNNSYGGMETPPVHPRCRCSIAGLPASEVQELGGDFNGKFENRNKDYNKLSDLTKQMDEELGYQYAELIRATNRAVLENLKHGLPAKVQILKFQNRASVIINGSNVVPKLQGIWGGYAKVGKILHMPLEGGVEAYKTTRLMLTQSGEIPATRYPFSPNVPAKHVNQIKEAFGKLESKYGAVTDRITDVGSLSWSGAGKPPIAYTQRVDAGNRIVFVEEHWALDEKTVDKMLTKNYDVGWTATPGANGITNHEFGHRVDDYLTRVKGINTNLPYVGNSQTVSSISELDAGQEFAEVFALYESGNAPGNLQVRAMAELLRQGGLIP